MIRNSLTAFSSLLDSISRAIEIKFHIPSGSLERNGFSIVWYSPVMGFGEEAMKFTSQCTSGAGWQYLISSF